MKTNIKDYILKYYTGNEKDYLKICSDIYNTFRKELYNCEQDFRYYKNNEFNAFVDWMQGGSSVFDTDYYMRRSAIKDLFFILGQEIIPDNIYDEEIIADNIYDEEKAEEAITTLIYLTVKRLLIEV